MANKIAFARLLGIFAVTVAVVSALLVKFANPAGNPFVDYQDLPNGGVSITHGQNLDSLLFTYISGSVGLYASAAFLVFGGTLAVVSLRRKFWLQGIAAALLGAGVTLVAWHFIWSNMFVGSETLEVSRNLRARNRDGITNFENHIALEYGYKSRHN